MIQGHKSYISTRLSILADRLIGPGNYAAIVEEDLDSLIKRVTDGTTADDFDPGLLQSNLISQALRDFNMLFRPFNGNEKAFLNFAVHWYELSNLKALIRGKFTGSSDADIKKELIDLERFNQLPLDTLLEADDPNEMMRLLEQTPYSSIVRQAREIYHAEGQNLFALDATIDREFFTGLSQRVRFLDNEDRQQLGALFGTLMDRLNILWLIRYRFSYGLSPAKSFFLLSTTGRKLHTGNLMRLAKLESIDDLISQLPSPLDELLANQQSLIQIENIMEHYVIESASNALKYSPSVITRLFAYILLRESEIQLLHAVIKGKSLNFDEQLILQATGGNVH